MSQTPTSPPSPNVPSREALEATHTFPGTYLFKAVGPNEKAFRDAVEKAVVETPATTPLMTAHRVSVRESTNGVHQAISIEALFPDAAAVQEAYRRLAAVPGIILIL